MNFCKKTIRKISVIAPSKYLKKHCKLCYSYLKLDKFFRQNKLKASAVYLD